MEGVWKSGRRRLRGEKERRSPVEEEEESHVRVTAEEDWPCTIATTTYCWSILQIRPAFELQQ